MINSQKERNHWNYFFKWVGPTADLAKKHKNDLFENDEYGYRVLKVTCTDFICFPYPEHQYSYLSTIQLGLTSDMRHQKLTLGFSDFITTHRTSKVRTCLGQGNMVHNKIELSPVTKCVILDWWHPVVITFKFSVENLHSIIDFRSIRTPAMPFVKLFCRVAKKSGELLYGVCTCGRSRDKCCFLCCGLLIVIKFFIALVARCAFKVPVHNSRANIWLFHSMNIRWKKTNPTFCSETLRH